MYYIYHIPGVKIGCTKNIESRIKAQGYSDYEILEEHTDIYVASDREIALQKQYGLPVDRLLYWKSIKQLIENPKTIPALKNSKLLKKTGKKSLELGKTKENQSKNGKIGGKIAGQIAKDSGHIQALGRKNMLILHSTHTTCPYCNKTIKGTIYFRWHGDNCKAKSQ
jgi:hypothetical protein